MSAELEEPVVDLDDASSSEDEKQSPEPVVSSPPSKQNKRKQSKPTKKPVSTKTIVGKSSKGQRARHPSRGTKTVPPSASGATKDGGGITKPKRKYRQGTIILRDIKKQQKIAHIKKAFPRRTIKLLIQEACNKCTPNGLRIQSKAIDALHEDVEARVIKLMTDLITVMVGCKHKQLIGKHFETLKALGLVPMKK